MRLALLAIIVLLFGFIAGGCQDLSAGSTNTGPIVESAPGKGGRANVKSAEMVPGPGVKDAESRVGSLMKDAK